MNTYTAHVRADRSPVLVQEGWSWGAAVFGPFWLLAQRAWIPGLLFLALTLLAWFALGDGVRDALDPTLQL